MRSEQSRAQLSVDLHWFLGSGESAQLNIVDLWKNSTGHGIMSIPKLMWP